MRDRCAETQQRRYIRSLRSSRCITRPGATAPPRSSGPGPSRCGMRTGVPGVALQPTRNMRQPTVEDKSRKGGNSRPRARCPFILRRPRHNSWASKKIPAPATQPHAVRGCSYQGPEQQSDTNTPSGARRLKFLPHITCNGPSAFSDKRPTLQPPCARHRYPGQNPPRAAAGSRPAVAVQAGAAMNPSTLPAPGKLLRLVRDHPVVSPAGAVASAPMAFPRMAAPKDRTFHKSRSTAASSSPHRAPSVFRTPPSRAARRPGTGGCCRVPQAASGLVEGLAILPPPDCPAGRPGRWPRSSGSRAARGRSYRNGSTGGSRAPICRENGRYRRSRAPGTLTARLGLAEAVSRDRAYQPGHAASADRAGRHHRGRGQACPVRGRGGAPGSAGAPGDQPVLLAGYQVLEVTIADGWPAAGRRYELAERIGQPGEPGGSCAMIRARSARCQPATSRQGAGGWRRARARPAAVTALRREWRSTSLAYPDDGSCRVAGLEAKRASRLIR